MTDPKSLENTLREIAQLDEHLARRLIHEIIERSRNAATGDCAKLLEAALAAGLVTDAGEFWAVATPLFRENEELTKRVLLHVCSSGEIRGRNMFAQKLKTDDLADLYLTLQHVFPRQEDPPFNGSAVPPRRSIIFVRDELPGHISARGTAEACAALLHLIDQLPDEAIWLRRLYREALRTKRRAAWDPPSPADVCQIIERRDVRLVRNDDELLDAVLESLERFQIQHTQRTLPAVERFWNHEGMGQRRQGFRPKDEEFLSDEIARWLRDDLGSNRNVIVGREVQPRRGKKPDITVEAAIPANGMHTTEESPPCIVIEVKGCWNAKVKTALESQLIDDYLKPHGLTHGVYLVGWFVCDRWDGPWRGSKNCLAATTYAEAVGYVDQLANPFDGRQRPFRISGVVLDLMLPP